MIRVYYPMRKLSSQSHTQDARLPLLCFFAEGFKSLFSPTSDGSALSVLFQCAYPIVGPSSALVATLEKDANGLRELKVNPRCHAMGRTGQCISRSAG